MPQNTDSRNRLLEAIRTIPDFPEPGIQFKDITPVLLDPRLLKEALSELVAPLQDLGITKVLGIESRGFILGAMLAERLHAGFVPVRKAGKLPASTLSESYSLEYGTAAIEMHDDAVQSGDRVLVHDDVIATGGTAAAASRLVERSGAVVIAYSFFIELSFLNGRTALNGSPIHSVLVF